MTKFLCRQCHLEKPIEECRETTYGKLRGNGQCKKCHSEYVKLKAMRDRVERNPERYNECLDCDRYFSKYSSGNAVSFVTTCKFCYSQNTVAVLPETV